MPALTLLPYILLNGVDTPAVDCIVDDLEAVPRDNLVPPFENCCCFRSGSNGFIGGAFDEWLILDYMNAYNG